MREDIAYQRRFSSYLTTLIILVIIPVVGWAIAIYLAIRQQQFQNRRIGDALQAVA
jgi:preprotein translocase subunit YajC